MLMFFMFFGMCFGDLVYGIMLIGVAALLKRRFAGQKNLVEFFRLFTYAGVTTIIFGVLTGSWASDLTSYFGQGNALDRLRVRLTLLDPMQKPMLALGIAIGIGIVNQFYGIVLKFLSSIWKGDIKSALYDGGLWFVYLSSLLAAGLSAAGALPGGIAKPALAVVIASAVGLVLTQGRDQKTWGLRIATGVVSLYGILGGYGTTSFIGDVLSYSRLLALGMTTTVIGMAFNIVAGFVRIVPVAGWALFVLVVLFGHSFNFIMSILGSFVHPARLMFLEFFGRFYESGGTAFRPFGFRSNAVELVEAH
jgi:V/A-type H+-transporting ATPase subunit I